MEIVGPMGGRGVDGTRALLGCHIVGEHSEHFAVEKGVLKSRAIQPRAGEARQLPQLAQPAGFTHRRQQLGRDKVHIARRGLDGRVLKLRVERNGDRGRQRPRGSRPDNRPHLAARERGVKRPGLA